MPAPERILALVKKATEHLSTTPGRIGFTLRLQNCTEVLVAGDLHGHIPNFQAIHQAAALAEHPTRHLILQEVVHSKFHYPKGGDKSHQLLDLFCVLKSNFPERVHLLPGNHELAQMTNRAIGKGDESQNADFRKGVDVAYGVLGAEIYAAYMELLRKLPIAIYAPNHVLFTHSLTPAKWMGTLDARKLEQDTLDAKEYEPGGIVYGIVWGRDTSHRNIDDYLRKMDADFLVSGHIPTEQGFLVPNHKQLIVDCSATPAAYALIPTTQSLTLAGLTASVVVLD